MRDIGRLNETIREAWRDTFGGIRKIGSSGEMVLEAAGDSKRQGGN